MKMLIPIHDPYGMMVLGVLALGSFGVSKRIHDRWLKPSFSIIGTNVLVKTAIALFGWQFFNMYIYLQRPPMTVYLLGIGLGIASVIFEEKILHHFNRRNRSNSAIATEIQQPIFIQQRLTLSSHRKYYGLKNIRKPHTKFNVNELQNYNVLTVILVAVMEEILFRGYLLAFKESMHFSLSILYILFITSMFACAHLNKSFYSVICKLPLTIFTTLGFLFTDQLLTPILTHGCLNLYVYFKKQNKVCTQPNTLPLGMH